MIEAVIIVSAYLAIGIAIAEVLDRPGALTSEAYVTIAIAWPLAVVFFAGLVWVLAIALVGVGISMAWWRLAAWARR